MPQRKPIETTRRDGQLAFLSNQLALLCERDLDSVAALVVQLRASDDLAVPVEPTPRRRTATITIPPKSEPIRFDVSDLVDAEKVAK